MNALLAMLLTVSFSGGGVRVSPVSSPVFSPAPRAVYSPPPAVRSTPSPVYSAPVSRPTYTPPPVSRSSNTTVYVDNGISSSPVIVPVVIPMPDEQVVGNLPDEPEERHDHSLWAKVSLVIVILAVFGFVVLIVRPSDDFDD